MSDTAERVRGIIVEHLGVDEEKVDSALEEDALGNLDSQTDLQLNRLIVEYVSQCVGGVAIVTDDEDSGLLIRHYGSVSLS